MVSTLRSTPLYAISPVPSPGWWRKSSTWSRTASRPGGWSLKCCNEGVAVSLLRCQCYLFPCTTCTADFWEGIFRQSEMHRYAVWWWRDRKQKSRSLFEKSRSLFENSERDFSVNRLLAKLHKPKSVISVMMMTAFIFEQMSCCFECAMGFHCNRKAAGQMTKRKRVSA